MRFTTALFASAIVLLVLASGLGMGLGRSQGQESIDVTILFDLGDGTYHWIDVRVYDPTAANGTWDAVLDAAGSLGLDVEWTWFDCCGVFITDIGNRSPPSGSVGIFLWKGTGPGWELAPTGVSDLNLEPGGAVAFSDNAFDPVTYEVLTPVPTPENPYPVLGFRGDYANSGTTGSSAPEGVGIKWDRDLGIQEIPASPAVAYGRVYILTLDGMFALDESSGAALWYNPSVRGLSTPAVFNGALLLGGSDGKVHAVDATTGTERWNTTLIAPTVFSGITSSPKVLFDTLYIGTFNETGGVGEVAALWATNGTIRWRHAAPGSVSFSTPAVVNGTLFVGVIGRYNTTTQITYDPPYGLLALDTASGSERWFAPTDGSVAASPIVVGPYVIVPSKDGFVYAWDRADGRLAWRTAAGAGVSSPAVHEGLIFVAGGSFGGRGNITALEATTGVPRWLSSPGGPVQSSVTYADGELFFSTNEARGTIYAVDAASGHLIWSYTPSPAQYILGSPVVADGLVIAPSDNGHVYAIDTPDELMALEAAGPASVAVGETATITLHATAEKGLSRGVWLNLSLTGLEFVSAEPAPIASSRFSASWYLEDLPMGRNRTATVAVRGTADLPPPAACDAGRCTERASLFYRGFHGTEYPGLSRTLSVTVGSATVSDLAPSSVLIVSAGAVLVAAVIALAVFLQRRSRRGP